MAPAVGRRIEQGGQPFLGQPDEGLELERVEVPGMPGPQVLHTQPDRVPSTVELHRDRGELVLNDVADPRVLVAPGVRAVDRAARGFGHTRNAIVGIGLSLSTSTTNL